MFAPDQKIIFYLFGTEKLIEKHKLLRPHLLSLGTGESLYVKLTEREKERKSNKGKRERRKRKEEKKKDRMWWGRDYIERSGSLYVISNSRLYNYSYCRP